MKRKSLLFVTLPLWVLAALWLVVQRKPVQDADDLAARSLLLNEIYYELVSMRPQGVLEDWLIGQVKTWVNHEIEALAVLNRIGMAVSGYIKK